MGALKNVVSKLFGTDPNAAWAETSALKTTIFDRVPSTTGG